MQFFVNETKEVILGNGGKGFEPIQKEVSLNEAISLSAKAFDDLTELAKSYGSMMSEYMAQDEVCVELGKRFTSLKAVDSPLTKGAESELTQATRKRNRIRGVYAERRDRLFRTLEMLAEPLIVKTLNDWLDIRRGLGDQVKFRTLEKKVLTGGPVFKIESNRKLIRNILKEVEDAEHQLRNFRHEPLKNILEFIQKKEVHFKDFDLEKLELENNPIDVKELGNLKKGPEATNKPADKKETYQLLKENEFVQWEKTIDRKIKAAKK